LAFGGHAILDKEIPHPSLQQENCLFRLPVRRSTAICTARIHYQ
jgi:hypothetical protein